MFCAGGMSIKPPDHRAVFACSACHDALDGRSNCKWTFEDVLRALMKTHDRLLALGILTLGKKPK